MSPRVMQALAGLLAVSELDGDEQEEFFEEFAAATLVPTATEREFWADRNRRDLGVGMDDEGNMVFAAVLMPGGPSTVQ